jgi:hypothetical protein
MDEATLGFLLFFLFIGIIYALIGLVGRGIARSVGEGKRGFRWSFTHGPLAWPVLIILTLFKRGRDKLPPNKRLKLPGAHK